MDVSRVSSCGPALWVCSMSQSVSMWPGNIFYKGHQCFLDRPIGEQLMSKYPGRQLGTAQHQVKQRLNGCSSVVVAGNDMSLTSVVVLVMNVSMWSMWLASMSFAWGNMASKCLSTNQSNASALSISDQVSCIQRISSIHVCDLTHIIFLYYWKWWLNYLHTAPVVM